MKSSSPAALVARIFQGKTRSRQQAATLPIEEKLRRLVEMQRRANQVRLAAKRRPMRVWELP
jgi:DNA-binding MurR/RpiR family transcriptional regulator